jgi:hypothetical protein
MTSLDSVAKIQNARCMASEDQATFMSAIIMENRLAVCCAAGFAAAGSVNSRAHRCLGASFRWRNVCWFLSTWLKDAVFGKPPG